MLRQTSVVFVFTMLCACGNNTESLSSGKKDSSANVGAANTESALLTFQDLKNSKWIIGEAGVSGEETDTIIFAKPDTLTYISAGNNKEFYHYTFNKDTLIFFSQTVETDVKSSKDLNCSTVSRLHYENGYFKYIYFDKKCTGDKDSKRTIIDTLDIKLRRL